ncbi:MAG: NAD(P)-dependent alcohol dehydrogenase [Gammaproteobacteria bacterium]|nr:NAD(P)-dependent alcohol dehydrogenase [Gammaproteobacteria bacterium]
MKILTYRNFGSADVLEWSDWELPKCSNNSVVIKLTAASVNPKDILLRKGKFSRTLARDPLPRSCGMDGSGVIVDVGHDIQKLKVGDKVMSMTNQFIGCMHAEYAEVKENEVFKLPDDIDDLTLQTMAAMPLAGMTALQGLRDYGQLLAEQKVLVVGASGGVGHFAIQIAVALGATVDGVCSAQNIEFIQSLGAKTGFDYRKGSSELPCSTYDLVFDVFGKTAFSDYKNCLKSTGRYVSKVPTLQNIFGELRYRAFKSSKIRLVNVWSNTQDMSWLFENFRKGALKPTISNVYEADQMKQAHCQIESKHTLGKVLIRIG